MGVDRDPLLIWLVTNAIIGSDVIRMTRVGCDPIGRSRRAMRVYRDGDDLSRDGWVRLLGGADREVVRAIAVVEELVGQVQLIVVPKAIEGPHRVGIISPALVARDVPLNAPGLAAVKGLVEAQQVIVALGTHNPLGGADQVVGVGGIDPDVGLRMVLDQHGGGGRIARVATGLGGIGTKVLTGVGSTIADRFTAVTIVKAVIR